MENNEYRENLQEEDSILEPELVYTNELTMGQELISDQDELNVGVTVFSDENENASFNRQEMQGQPQTAPGATASAGTSAGGAAATGGGAAAAGAGATGGIACAAVAGVTLMVVIASIMVNISVYFLRFDVFETFISYAINVKLEIKLDKETQLDYDNLNTGLILSVTNGNIKFLTPLDAADKNLEATYKIISETDELVKIEYDFNGHIEGLIEGETYNLEVFSEDNGIRKSYYSRTFKTKAKISKINLIKIENKQKIDGNLYFQIDFIDENNYYSNFTYMILKSGSEVPFIRGEMKGDLGAKTAINISDLRDKSCTLIITYLSSAPSDAENPTKNIVTEITL